MINFNAIMAALLPPITAKFSEVTQLHPNGHKGVDFAVETGTKLFSIGAGTVESVVDYGSKNIGRGVMLKLDNGISVIYGHLSRATVKIGQTIKPGELIGYSGNTGRSTGPHLHLQMYNKAGKLMDPLQYAEDVFTAKTGWDPWGLGEKLTTFNDGMENFLYWINPVNWVKESFHWLDVNIGGGVLDDYFIALSILLVILIVLGAKWPKRYLYWGWIVFWLLRGFVFNG